MGPCWRISCAIISRTDKTLVFLSGWRRAAWDSTLLRSVGKHFDEIVMQAIVELALQMPCELGMLEVAGMNRKYVGVHRDGRVLQVDQHFDYTVVLARGKSQQRMLVEPQVIIDFLQGVGHGSIVLRWGNQFPVLRKEQGIENWEPGTVV